MKKAQSVYWYTYDTDISIVRIKNAEKLVEILNPTICPEKKTHQTIP